MTTAVLQTVQALHRAPSVLKIRELLRAATAAYGYDFFFCSAPMPANETSTPGAAMFSEWPEEWSRLYREQRLFVTDPVAAFVKQTAEPFFWNEVPGRGRSQAASRVMGDAASFGLREGLVVPLYGIGGRLHCLSMAGTNPRCDMEARAELHLLSIYAYARAKQLQRRDPEPRVQISRREREALVWAAAGKTDWEIGELLRITEGAAHKRIESAKRKYGVSTRVQAIVEAMRRGHINV